MKGHSAKEISINNLPKRYHFSYQYSEFLYNNLSQTFNSLKKKKLFDHTINFKNKTDAKKFGKLVDEEFLDKLLESEYYRHHAFSIIYKQLIEALLYDYLTYTSEALINILKGNYSISYTLLRKPFKEILTVFELICKDPVEFFVKFWTKDPSSYAIESISNELKLSNIETVVQMVNKFGIHIPDILYDLRFNRFKENSYEKYWNKSIHLITTRKNIETEKRNLNLIFANNEDKNFMRHHILISLPIILNYTNDVVETLVSLFARAHDTYLGRRLFGFYAWSYEMHLSKKSKSKTRNLLFKEIKGVECPRCTTPLRFNKKTLIECCLLDTVTCQNCGFDYNLELTFEDNEHLIHPIFRN